MAYVEWREEDEGRREMKQERGFIPEYEGKQNTRLILDIEELSTKLQKNISAFICSFSIGSISISALANYAQFQKVVYYFNYIIM